MSTIQIKIAIFLIATCHSSFSFLAPTPTCSNCPACQNSMGCGDAETASGNRQVTTTESSESTTLEFYQKFWRSQGWDTDDSGNVFVGDDNAKLSLISIGSYCPAVICKGWFGIL